MARKHPPRLYVVFADGLEYTTTDKAHADDYATSYCPTWTKPVVVEYVMDKAVPPKRSAKGRAR